MNGWSKRNKCNNSSLRSNSLKQVVHLPLNQQRQPLHPCLQYLQHPRPIHITLLHPCKLLTVVHPLQYLPTHPLQVCNNKTQLQAHKVDLLRAVHPQACLQTFLLCFIKQRKHREVNLHHHLLPVGMAYLLHIYQVSRLCRTTVSLGINR